MITLTNLNSKLDNFLTYSIGQFNTIIQNSTVDNAYKDNLKQSAKSQCTSIIESLRTSLKNYYNADRSSLTTPLHDVVLSMYSDLLARGTKTDKNIDYGYSKDYPAYYLDLSKIFKDFSCIGECDNVTFFNAYNYNIGTVTDKETQTTSTVITISNSLISKWLNESVVDVGNEANIITSLIQWLSNSMNKSSGINLWEDTGNVTEQIQTKDIAKEIFINRKLKDAINTYKLNAYVPTYV